MPFNIFRKAVTVYRRTMGDYTTLGNGLYAPALEEEESFTGTFSVQPATGKDTLLLPEGRRSREAYALFGSVELKSSDFDEPCDQVLIAGKRFDVLVRETWNNGVINHYKYIVGAVQE